MQSLLVEDGGRIAGPRGMSGSKWRKPEPVRQQARRFRLRATAYYPFLSPASSRSSDRYECEILTTGATRQKPAEDQSLLLGGFFVSLIRVKPVAKRRANAGGFSPLQETGPVEPKRQRGTTSRDSRQGPTVEQPHKHAHRGNPVGYPAPLKLNDERYRSLGAVPDLSGA